MVKKKKKVEACCGVGSQMIPACPFAILIIVLVWVSGATWSKIVITVAAALILMISGSHQMAMKKQTRK